MGQIKPLIIGDLVIQKPIIQGGMGVGISLHRLAGAVAKAGGLGIISTAQIGFQEPDFKEDPLRANLRAIAKELEKARKIAPDGAIGFNIMVATKRYSQYVKAAVMARDFRCLFLSTRQRPRRRWERFAMTREKGQSWLLLCPRPNQRQ